MEQSIITVTSAKYVLGLDGNNSAIEAIVGNRRMSVPLDPANRHYAEIMRQVEAGELTIQEADS